MKSKKVDKVKRKEKLYNIVSELYNRMFENYYDEYNKLSGNKKNTYDQKLKPKNFKLEDVDYDGWFTEEELDDMPPLEGEEEVKKGK